MTNELSTALPSGASVFLVGGAVRDQLLGLAVRDRDYVVTGARPEDLLSLGFRAVGKDFPVFLHPQTQEEYALARTERKVGAGYHGFAVHFSPEVTLTDDLARRDLTINAMAIDAQGLLVDPYGGLSDLRAGILRHVGPSFAEDPVRILRLARFAARYPTFSIAPETMQLMQGMVAAGEVDTLVAERVWQELAKGLMEQAPSRMIEVLHLCGALRVLLPELDALYGIPQPVAHHPEGDVATHVRMALEQAAALNAGLPVRFAVLLHDLGKGVTPAASWPAHHDHEALGVPLVTALSQRLKVPAACRELAVLVARYHTHSHRAQVMRPGSVVKLLGALDAFRRPDRFQAFLLACQCDAQGRLGRQNTPYPARAFLGWASDAAKAVDVAALLANGCAPADIPGRVHEARTRQVAALARSIDRAAKQGADHA